MFVALFAVSIGAGGFFFREPAPAGVATVVQHVEEAFAPSPERVFGKDRLRVLVIGLDYDYDRLDQETSKSSRSDVIMALSFDFKNHKINELSVPRDMVATLPNGRTAKINQAQSDGGITESKSVIANWLGVPSFDRYVVMRINTSKDVIDALGGIDVEVKNSNALKRVGPNGPVDYDDNWGHLHVHLKPGMQHLGGDQAVGYARFRHDWCSDPCRIMRQQQVLRSIVGKLEHDRLNTFTHAQALLGVVRKDIETDFTLNEELASVLAFTHLDEHSIHTAQVPYTGSIMLPDYGDSIVPDEVEKRKLVAALLLDPLTDTRVRLENGTANAGLAGRVAVDLRAKGFIITEVVDAPMHDVATTRIERSRSDAVIPAGLQTALGGSAAVVRSPTSSANDATADVTVVLGRDVIATHP